MWYKPYYFSGSLKYLQYNTFNGTPGDDYFISSLTKHDYLGGTGTDTVDYQKSSAGVRVNLDRGTGSGGFAEGDTYSSVENVVGSSYSDVLIGNNSDNILSGKDGDDSFYGSRGYDTIIGGTGNNFLSYTGLRDTSIVVDLREGINQVNKGHHGEFDTISDISQIAGTYQNDTFVTGDGEYTLYGMSGNDTFHASLGENTLYGGDGWDTADYQQHNGSVIVNLETGRIQKVASEPGTASTYDQVQNIENVIGTNYSDLFFGDHENNTFRGAGGNDLFFQSAGTDTYLGQGGDDKFFASSGDGYNIYNGGIGFDSFFAEVDASRIDLANGSSNGDLIEGNVYSDIELFAMDGSFNTLIGSTNNDILVIGGDNSSANGGAGNDVMSIEATYEEDSSLSPNLFGEKNSLDGGAGIDTLSFNLDSINGNIDFTTPQGVNVDLENGELTSRSPGGDDQVVDITNIENVVGTEYGDIIRDDTGDNVLTGSGGADIFIFADHDDVGQNDIITDFEVGVDRIDLSNSEINGWRDLNNRFPDDDYMGQVGENVVIYTSDFDTVTLEDVNIASLNADDFIF